MRELGSESRLEHRKVLEQLANQADLESVWLVGEEFIKALAETPLPTATAFSTVEEVETLLRKSPICGRTILVKGSNGTHLYRLPEML